MSKTIPGVPESVTREQYLSFFQAAGFEPSAVKSLRFLPEGIEAVVFERHPNGSKVLVQDQECTCTFGRDGDLIDDTPLCEKPILCQAQHGFAKHTIFIPVAHGDKEGA